MSKYLDQLRRFEFTDILGWSYSRFATFQQCKRKYFYDYYAKRTRDVTRKGLDAGAIPLSLPLNPGVTVWFIFEPGVYDPQDLLQRGRWRVRSTTEFRELTLLELGDESAQTAPATSAATLPAHP